MGIMGSRVDCLYIKICFMFSVFIFSFFLFSGCLQITEKNCSNLLADSRAIDECYTSVAVSDYLGTNETTVISYCNNMATDEGRILCLRSLAVAAAYINRTSDAIYFCTSVPAEESWWDTTTASNYEERVDCLIDVAAITGDETPCNSVTGDTIWDKLTLANKNVMCRRRAELTQARKENPPTFYND